MKKFFAPIIFLLFVSCSQPTEEIPGNILSVEQMTAIMVDIQLIEGGVVIMKYNKDKDHNEILDYYRSLYQAHQINKPLFDKSLKYYCERPDLFVQIYDGVIIQLSEIQAEVENKAESEKKESN